MNTKLTLTIEQEIIEKAKKYAKSKGRSLSDLVENYFKTIVDTDPQKYKNQGSIAASLLGTFKEPENFDYKKDLQNFIAEKHLNNG